MDLGIKGKTALVLASSRGLGQAMAVALAREGVQVAITGRNPEGLSQTVAMIEAAGGKAAAEEASGEEEAAEDDTAIYVSSSPAPVRMRQKRKANVPDGVYMVSRPTSRPRAWMTRMKDLKDLK
jgi:NAD(P)-dependent dehydrogenase (short-subunit alcohol dehydrogenase family)